MKDHSVNSGTEHSGNESLLSPRPAQEGSLMPKIGEFLRGSGTLVAIEDTQPPPIPPPTKDYIFEEITARVEMRLGDEVVKEIIAFTDFYGKGKSVSAAIEHATDYANARGLGRSSEVEIVVVKVVSQVRTYPSQTTNYYNKEYPSFAALSWGCKRGLPDDIETDVWSSRDAPERDAETVQDLS